MFPITLESSLMTTIVFGNLKFPKKLGPICTLWVSILNPLREDLMSTYCLGYFNSLSELQFHVAKSNLCRLPATSRVDSKRQLPPTGP